MDWTTLLLACAIVAAVSGRPYRDPPDAPRAKRPPMNRWGRLAIDMLVGLGLIWLFIF